MTSMPHRAHDKCLKPTIKTDCRSYTKVNKKKNPYNFGMVLKYIVLLTFIHISCFVFHS